MKRTLLAVCAAALLLAPAALAVEPQTVEPQTPSAYCTSLRTSQPALFGAGKTYRNLGACVSRQNAQVEASAASAAKTCKAEQSDANFAASHDGKTFAAFYGTSGDKANGKGSDNGNGNALGKCVSRHASQQTAGQQAAELKSARICRAELKLTPEQFAAKYPGKTFASKYGTNRNGKNALGKCVSALAKAS